MSDVAGLHLLAHLDLVSSPRRSVVARLDRSGRLRALEEAAGDAEVIAAVEAQGASLVVVDAPLAVPRAGGRRDAEAVLSWCDVPAFPVSARRLDTVFGGARGVALADRLAGAGRRVLEALPDHVLRQISWEAGRPEGAPAMDLAAYRAAWLGVRAPRYRPKGVGRARPEGVMEAWRLLARVVDMDGWTPAASPGDWEAIADAARIDAICCAYAGLRLEQGAAVVLGTPGRGEMAVPVDANLRARLAATLERLRGEGTIVI
jgi:predicted nuclease with RNAse H fold